MSAKPAKTVRLKRTDEFLLATFAPPVVTALLIYIAFATKVEREPTVRLCLFAALFFGLLSAVGVYITFFYRIQAGEQGIRIRGYKQDRLIEWASVDDYYIEFGHPPSHRKSLVVQSGRTYLRVNPTQWKNADAFAGLVRERAFRARVSNWEIVGIRSVDPPEQTFHIGPEEMIALSTIAGLLLISGLCGIAWMWMQLERNDLSFKHPLVLQAAVAALTLAGFYITARFGTFAYLCWQRSRDRFTTKPTELIFSGKIGEVRSSWEEVSVDPQRARGTRLTLHMGQHTRPITVSQYTRNLPVLEAIILKRAGSVKAPDRRSWRR